MRQIHPMKYFYNENLMIDGIRYEVTYKILCAEGTTKTNSDQCFTT